MNARKQKRTKPRMTPEELCTHCHRDTSATSAELLWVNRIPSDDGWMCIDCQVMPCDVCGDQEECDLQR